MKINKVSAVMVAVVLVLAAAFFVEAGQFGPRMLKGGPGLGLGGLRAFLDLNLSDSQQEIITNITNKYQGLRQSLRDRLIETKQNLDSVVKADPFDEAAVRTAFGEASVVRADMFVLRAQMMTEMKAVLTPEQLELLQERRTTKTYGMKKRFGARSEKPSQ